MAPRDGETPTTLDGVNVLTGEPVRLGLRDGRIAYVEALPPTAAEHVPLLGPGLVDLQINGYAGIDLSGSTISAQDVTRLTRLLWREAVTTFCPTVITNSDDGIAASLRAIAAACAADPLVDSMVAGIHLEGPFLSPADGPRGVHNIRYVKPPEWDLFRRWQEDAGGRIRLITLAPERPGALEFIGRCVAAGILVAIGHTAAEPEVIRAAVAAGARLSTHLGNGAHVMMPRHRNYIWEQLAQDDLWASFIPDGFHLPEAVLTVGLRAKRDRALLVSDAVAISGLPPGHYTMHDGTEVVLAPSGRLHLAANPALLAGSAQMLPWGIAHLARSGLCDLGEAWLLASLRPATCLGLPTAAGLAPGAPADLVLAGWDGRVLAIDRVYKAGRLLGSARG
ncbi:MAG: hypothetical protein NVSMB65_17650 [Chloroflexota bacterium]